MPGRLALARPEMLGLRVTGLTTSLVIPVFKIMEGRRVAPGLFNPYEGSRMRGD